jgi:hypothetical protein
MASLGAAPWFDLALAILATWRLCHLVAREDGPFDLILRLRLRAGSGMVARLLDCPYCLSLWVAAPIAAWQARDLVTGLLLWQAISAGSCLLTMAADGLVAGASPAAPLAPPLLGPVSRALGPGRGR